MTADRASLHDDALWAWSAVRIATAVRRREVSVEEVVTAHLARLADVNPAINAVVEVDAEGALAAARRADRAIARGEPLGLLHGVPVTTKINVDQAGSATSNGVVAFRDAIATDDSPVIANLRHAGAIILGRTNVPAFSWRWFTDNDLHGRTFNPWQRGLTPGGSSGGAAAAVATGIGPLAQGSDLAGSIRYPAYACGVAGLRPTFGRIPAFEPSAPADRPLFSRLFVTQGPLARHAGDLRLALHAMARGDARDPWWLPLPFPAAPDDRPLRIAVSPGDAAACAPPVAAALQEAAARLRDAGCEVVEADPPSFRAVCDLFAGLMAEARAGLVQRIEEYGDLAVRRAAAGMLAAAPTVDLTGYIELFARRTFHLREWYAFLARHDVLLMPTSWQPPFPIDADQGGDAAVAALVEAQMPLLAVSALGLPGLAMPLGLDADGAPTGVQLVAAPWHEEHCLVAAELIEARQAPLTPIDPRQDGRRRPPPDVSPGGRGIARAGTGCS